ncbi:MAG: hypothetical protein AAB576_06765, partial [Elusimicrobiota bacterium]
MTPLPCVLLLGLLSPGAAQPPAAAAQGTPSSERVRSPLAQGAGQVPRKVLALYSREQIPGDYKDIAFTQLHQRGEMPLNHLGVELVYHDAAEPLPDPATLSGYRGVVTWFEKPVNFEDPAPVCRWLSDLSSSGNWLGAGMVAPSTRIGMTLIEGLASARATS